MRMLKPLARIIHESGTPKSFFRECETQIDDVRIWLDRETDSKVLSEVHVRLLTRRETLPVSA